MICIKESLFVWEVVPAVLCVCMHQSCSRFSVCCLSLCIRSMSCCSLRGIVCLCLVSFMTLLSDALCMPCLWTRAFMEWSGAMVCAMTWRNPSVRPRVTENTTRVTAASTRHAWRLAGPSRRPPGQHVQEHNTPNGQNPGKRP